MRIALRDLFARRCAIGLIVASACAPGAPVTSAPTRTPAAPSPTPAARVARIATAAGDATGIARPMSGSGGPARAAGLAGILAVAAGTRGELYIAETVTGSGRADEIRSLVRKVSAAGVITVLAGSGVPGYRADPATGTFVACCRGDGTATGAYLGLIHALATGPGAALFVATSDPVSGAGLVYRIRTDTGQIALYAGGGTDRGTAGVATGLALGTPVSLYADAAGNLYVRERGGKSEGNWVRRVDPLGNTLVVLGTGPCGTPSDGAQALEARLCGMAGLAVDGSGDVYVAEGSEVYAAAPNGLLQRVAGLQSPGDAGDGGPAISARFRNVTALAITPAGLLIADADAHRLRLVDRSGLISTVAGTGAMGYSGDGGPAATARLNYPTSIALDGSGLIYLADAGNRVVRRIEGCC